MYMYQPLVEKLLQHKDKGTSCVLTQTNEEAVILMALLRKHGINSKLIQSMNGLRFWTHPAKFKDTVEKIIGEAGNLSD